MDLAMRTSSHIFRYVLYRLRTVFLILSHHQWCMHRENGDQTYSNIKLDNRHGSNNFLCKTTALRKRTILQNFSDYFCNEEFVYCFVIWPFLAKSIVRLQRQHSYPNFERPFDTVFPDLFFTTFFMTCTFQSHIYMCIVSVVDIDRNIGTLEAAIAAGENDMTF